MCVLRQLLRFAAAGVLALALGGPFLRAETWNLANGDRLTGTLVSDDGETLEIKHPHLGIVSFPKSALRPEKTAAAPGPGAKSDGESVAKPAAKPASPWKRTIEVGFTQQSGTRNKEDLSIRTQLDGKKGDNTFRGTARVLQAEADNRTVTDRREADFRWRHDINKRLFAQTQTTYAADDVRAIDLSFEQQVGGGYRIIDGKRHKANVGLGAVVQYLERDGFEDATVFLGSFFQDYAFTMNSRLKITQEANVLVSESNAFALQGGRSGVSGAPRDGSFRLKLNSAVQSKLTTQMSLNVRFEYDYDHSVPNPDLRGDQRITTSLGYVW